MLCVQGKQKVFQFYLDPYTASWTLTRLRGPLHGFLDPYTASCITEENLVMGVLRLYSGAYHSPLRTFFILFLINNVKMPDFIVIGKSLRVCGILIYR